MFKFNRVWNAEPPMGKVSKRCKPQVQQRSHRIQVEKNKFDSNSKQIIRICENRQLVGINCFPFLYPQYLFSDQIYSLLIDYQKILLFNFTIVEDIHVFFLGCTRANIYSLNNVKYWFLSEIISAWLNIFLQSEEPFLSTRINILIRMWSGNSWTKKVMDGGQSTCWINLSLIVFFEAPKTGNLIKECIDMVN